MAPTNTERKKYMSQRHIRNLRSQINKLEGWVVYQRLDSLSLPHKGSFDEVRNRLFRYDLLSVDPDAPVDWDPEQDQREHGELPFTLRRAFNDVSYDHDLDIPSSNSLEVQGKIIANWFLNYIMLY